MSRVTKSIVVKASSDDPYEFVLSSSIVDRVGDIVDVSGIDVADFRKNPIALFGHDHSRPIGVWEDVAVRGGQLVGKLKLAAAGTSQFIDELRSLVEQGILRAVSIGFSVKEAVRLKDTGGYRFVKTALHEVSLVSVPANQAALRIRGMNLSSDAMKTFFTGEQLPSVRGETSQVTKTGATRTADLPELASKGLKIMSIAEKINAKQERLLAIKNELSVLKSAVESDAELSAEDLDKIDTLTEEQDAVTKSIESLSKIEAGLAKKAEPVSKHFIAPGAHARKEEPGELMAKVAAAHFFAHTERKTVDQVVAERYRSDDRVNAVVKTAIGIADTTTVGWAAELVRTDVYGFLDALRPFSVYAALAALGTRIPFGNASVIQVPRRAGGTLDDLSGSFVGEAGVIPVKRMTTASTALSRTKMAVISTFSKELQRESTPQVEGIIRQAMLDDTARALDVALFDGKAAVAGVRPASILNGVGGTASAGATGANVITDLKVLMNTLASANAGRVPVIIMNPARLMGLATMTSQVGGFLFRDEISSGSLLGNRVITSTNVPAGQIIIVDAADFATAFGVAEFDVSDTATLTMANADLTAPTQADDGTGAVGSTADQVVPDGGISVAGAGATGAAATGYTAMSMFQQWSVAVRMVMPISWTMIRPGVVNQITGATW
jgi:HK97 family phage major capsid protein/HK97 family phage prohead protease